MKLGPQAAQIAHIFVCKDIKIHRRLRKGLGWISSCRGLMPLNFEGLKKQRFRWAFGGMQVLRSHWQKLLPAASNQEADNKLSFGQKFDYCSGGLQWFNNPITFLFTVILLINSISYTFTQSVFLEPMAGAGLLAPFVFIIFSLTRSLWALRVRLNCTAEAFRAMLVLLSLTWVVTLACTLGLTKKAGVFLRTPKQKGERSLLRSLRIFNEEIIISLVCIGAVAALLVASQPSTTVWLLGGQLMWQAFIYSASIIVTRWSYLSVSLAHHSSARLSSRTTGQRFNPCFSLVHKLNCRCSPPFSSVEFGTPIRKPGPMLMPLQPR